MSDKYTTINQFMKEYEQSLKEVVDAKLEENPGFASTKCAYQYGHALGTLNGLLYQLDLTEEQVTLLENYFKK